MSVDVFLNDLAKYPKKARDTVSQLEAAEIERLAAFGLRSDSFVLRGVEQGSRADIDRAVEQGFMAWQTANLAGRKANAAWLDATTLHTVERLTVDGSDCVSPGTILDLANFVTAAVLFDRLFTVQNASVDAVKLNAAFGGEQVVVALPVGDLSITDHTVRPSASDWQDLRPEQAAAIRLEMIWNNVASDMAATRDGPSGSFHGERARHIVKAWQRLFGSQVVTRSMVFPLVKEQVFVPGWSSEHWSSLAPTLLDHVMAADVLLAKGWDEDFRLGYQPEEDLVDIINACNYRSMFNIQLSGHLELPYWASTYRMPFQGAFHADARRIHRHLPTLALIEDAYRARRKQYYDPASDAALPFFFAAVLAKAGRPADILTLVAELRAKARSLRERRAEIDHAIRSDQVAEIDKLRKALAGEYVKSGYPMALGATCAAAAAVLASATTGLPTIALLALCLFAAGPGLVGAGLWDRLQMQFLRPGYVVVSSVSQSADRLGELYPRVQALWGVHPVQEPAFMAALRRLRAVAG